jgi:predicted aspartyl protease
MQAFSKGALGPLFLCALALCAAAAQATVVEKPAIPAQPAPKATLLPPLPPAVIDNTLQIGGADIAARKVDTRMTVAVEVEGRGPFRFVVDSGADTSALGLSTQRALRLPSSTQAMLYGMTASAMVDRVTASELKVGQSTIRYLDLPVLRDEDLGAQGLLGIDALVEQRLMMDFDKHVITIEDAHRPPPYHPGEIVVVARRWRGQLILTQASVNGHPVDAVIDTGSEITIGNLALRNLLFRKGIKKPVIGQATGVTGVVVTMQLAHLEEIQIGPIRMQDVDIAFADVPPFTAFGLTDRPALFLGTDLMANFRRVSLDFRARKVRFQLKKCKPQGLYMTTSMSWSRLSLGQQRVDAC